MELSVMSPVLNDMKLEETVKYLSGLGVDSMELGAGGYPGKAHIDPAEYIGDDAIYHFHAKDTKIDKANTSRIGVLDTQGYGEVLQRSWVFRTVGYGHGKEVWNNIISTLKTVGYDSVISIEHEDGLMSAEDGLEKAVRFLRNTVICESAGEMWWA